jgi:hypothetical protein
MTYLIQWLEYCFHRAVVFGLNPKGGMGRTYCVHKQDFVPLYAIASKVMYSCTYTTMLCPFATYAESSIVSMGLKKL